MQRDDPADMINIPPAQAAAMRDLPAERILEGTAFEY
jgi:hypothetical protein